MTDLIASKARWTAGAVFKGSLGGAAVGAVVNVLLFLAGGAMTSLSARFDPAAGPVDLKLAAVAIASLVPALPAGLAALLVGRFARQPATAFAVLAAVFGLLSMGGPANLAGAGVGLKVLLALMHVVSGVAITAGILRSAR